MAKTKSDIKNNMETSEIVNEQNKKTGTNKGAHGAKDDTIEVTQEEFEEFRQNIEKLQQERDEAINLAQRLQADFDNFRKRNATVRTDSMEEGKNYCIKALLHVLDNFDRAMENSNGVDENFFEGIKLVQRSLLDALNKLGMSEIPTDGQFNPELHNAVMQEHEDGREVGEILEVFQKGYEVNGKILRHSMVKVAE